MLNSNGHLHATESTITEEMVANLPPYHPARRLVGTTVNWDHPIPTRGPGDDRHFLGVTVNGRAVAVSHGLGFYFLD